MNTTNESPDRLCAHVPCTCEPSNADLYCSSQCEQGDVTETCRCGHEDCEGDALTVDQSAFDPQTAVDSLGGMTSELDVETPSKTTG